MNNLNNQSSPNSPNFPHHDPESPRRIHINRDVIPQLSIYPRFNKDHQNGGERRGRRMPTFLNSFKCTPVSVLLSLVPILNWLPKYNWRNDLISDLIAGFTISVLHIPQGMAYALLGNLPPIVGIYMAFFPVIIYTFLGTSRHVSMGTFAVVCLMTGKVVTERMKQYELEVGGFNVTSPVAIDEDEESTIFRMVEHEHNTKADYDVIEIATVVSMTVGIWQIILGFMRLGSLSILLSTELVSGFTTGAAIHVLTSQVRNLFGLSIPRRTGIFKIILTYVDIVGRIQKTNVTAFIMSAVTILFLIIYNEVLKPIISKKVPFPLPVELFTIIIGTLISRYWNMKHLLSIEIVDFIPTGLPAPKLPPMDIFPDVIIDGLVIAIVAYAISISMAKIFANKYSYAVDSNQELIAQGSSNIIGSFFSCAPIAASLSRSLVQDSVGGKTQLAGLFSSGILVFVLLWIGPFFETLPNCILSAIIVVALKGMLMQILDFPNILRQSKLNGFVWLASFLATIILDIEYGLAIGLAISVMILIWRSNKPNVSVLGEFGDSGLYADMHSNSDVKEIPGCKIIKCTGSLNFATVEHFVGSIQQIVKIESLKKKKKNKGANQRRIFKKPIIINTTSLEKINDSISTHTEDNISTSQHGITIEISIDWIILDFSSISSIDPGAARSIRGLYERYLKSGIQTLFAGSPDPVLQVFKTCNFLEEIGTKFFLPSVHDAVTFTGLPLIGKDFGSLMASTIDIGNIGVNNDLIESNLKRLDSLLSPPINVNRA